MNLEPPFQLTEGERTHPLWTRLKSHLEDRLRDARNMLERDKSENETAILRGQIKCLKSLIGLGDDPPKDG